MRWPSGGAPPRAVPVCGFEVKKVNFPHTKIALYRYGIKHYFLLFLPRGSSASPNTPRGTSFSGVNILIAKKVEKNIFILFLKVPGRPPSCGRSGCGGGLQELSLRATAGSAIVEDRPQAWERLLGTI